MVGELFHLARVAQKENYLPGFRAQQWYFFGVATFYLYVRWVTRRRVTSRVTGAAASVDSSCCAGGARRAR
jgi:phosphatidate cytidylyltransferase